MNEQGLLPERILCAAIWFDDDKKYELQPTNIETGFVSCGWRHGNCFTIVGAISGDYSLTSYRKDRGIHSEMPGFLTSSGRFLNRKEAYIIAERENQITASPTHHGILFSEDLY